MRPINAAEAEEIQKQVEAVEALRHPFEDEQIKLERLVQRVRRACQAPSDARLDESSLEWCKVEQGQQGQKLVPIKAD